jgi:hypothetical protein
MSGIVARKSSIDWRLYEKFFLGSLYPQMFWFCSILREKPIYWTNKSLCVVELGNEKNWTYSHALMNKLVIEMISFFCGDVVEPNVKDGIIKRRLSHCRSIFLSSKKHGGFKDVLREFWGHLSVLEYRRHSGFYIWFLIALILPKALFGLRSRRQAK